MLSFDKRVEGDVTVMTLNGALDEDCNFTGIVQDLEGNVRFRLGNVKVINSCGVREWIQAMAPLQDRCSIEYEDVSVPLVKQFNAVINVRGSGKVRSFMAPYYCEGCNEEIQEHLVIAEEGDHLGDPESLSAPPRTCPKCQASLEFDETEEKFFHFIKVQMKG